MNEVYTHPGQPQMQVEVILASRNSENLDLPPLFTIRLRYPRIIHGEVMTHRVFSRNARSSRAVPVKTMLDEVKNTPFVPWHWGKNQRGMQAIQDWDELIHLEVGGILFDYVTRNEAWLNAATCAVDVAEAFMDAGYHKQIPNRLLEPFSWIDTLITSNDWANFLWLRDHKDAEPHLQDLARLVKKALNSAMIQDLSPGEWHLPYINIHDKDHANSICGIRGDDMDGYLCKISAARCARISYKPFDGDASYKRELERYNMLVSADRVHASPLEHQATPDRIMNFAHEGDPDALGWEKSNLHGNLPGWVQARKLVHNECYPF